MKLRSSPNLYELGWLVLPKLLAVAALHDNSVKERRVALRATAVTDAGVRSRKRKVAELRMVASTDATVRRKKRKFAGLRETDPW